MSAGYELAQVNFGRLRAPVDHPMIKDFVDVVWLFLFVTIYVWGGWGAPIHAG